MEKNNVFALRHETPDFSSDTIAARIQQAAEEIFAINFMSTSDGNQVHPGVSNSYDENNEDDSAESDREDVLESNTEEFVYGDLNEEEEPPENRFGLINAQIFQESYVDSIEKKQRLL
ncbi:hypothetical protein DASC09_030910 [Saccharomycopsis crataegensis]|uniref:Uncharacterized protein n=1 Tax=Saccharomycopsis crataegensis TaxID=43959 RepID=A0AAV5QMB0_9ASCO|nr:hypothetical protein DASC09_030910 [Saccharomycopsis crataegensis]